jgi:hypothetical protein
MIGKPKIVYGILSRRWCVGGSILKMMQILSFYYVSYPKASPDA